MKGKTKLRVIQILCIVSLLITMFSIQSTYAKYFEKIGTTYTAKIKKWVINVNTKNIHDESTLANVMTPGFFYNPHMDTNGGTNNILVPGREGYFDFLIDYTNVDVPFKFEFDIKQQNQKTVVVGEGETEEIDAHLADFEVYGYAIVDNDFQITGTTKISDIPGVTVLTKNEGTGYDLSGITQQINPYTEANSKKRILVLFRWNDGEGSTMDNIADTAFEGEANGEDVHTLLKYKVKIKFTQLLEPARS